MQPIRNSAKAVIIQDGKLLCTKNEDQFGIFYLLPGGGQEKFETLSEALRRECREEIGAEIEIGDIVLIREYIGKNHEFAEWDAAMHQIEFMFRCRLQPGAMLHPGAVPDSMQIGVEWLELAQLNQYRIYPASLKRAIGGDGRIAGPIYLGDAG